MKKIKFSELDKEIKTLYVYENFYSNSIIVKERYKKTDDYKNLFYDDVVNKKQFINKIKKMLDSFGFKQEFYLLLKGENDKLEIFPFYKIKESGNGLFFLRGRGYIDFDKIQKLINDRMLFKIDGGNDKDLLKAAEKVFDLFLFEEIEIEVNNTKTLNDLQW